VGEWSAARLGRTLSPGKDPVPILQEAGWTPGPVWTDWKSRPHRDSIPDRPARSQSLYRLSYRVHNEPTEFPQISMRDFMLPLHSNWGQLSYRVITHRVVVIGTTRSIISLKSALLPYISSWVAAHGNKFSNSHLYFYLHNVPPDADIICLRSR